VVAKVRKILAVSKQAAQKFDVERFNLKKLNELEVRNSNRLRLQFCSFEELK
jgi:DNA-binding SARP family transcriptional activator